MSFWYIFKYFTSAIGGYVLRLFLYFLRTDMEAELNKAIVHGGGNEDEGGNLEATYEIDDEEISDEEISDEEENSSESKKERELNKAKEHDGDNEDEGGNFEATNENDEQISDEEKNSSEDKKGSRVLNIHIKNTESGTVVIGDTPTVNRYNQDVCEKFSSATASQREVNVTHETRHHVFKQTALKTEQPILLANKTALPLISVDPLFGHRAQGREENIRKTKKKKNRKESPKKPTPSVDKKVKSIHEQLTKCRENGEWEVHDETVKGLLTTYSLHDEDNYDILLQLEYERAAKLFAKNENKQARSLVNEIARKIKSKNVDNYSDSQKWVYFRCFLLTCDIYCRAKRFGQAEKALKEAEDFMNKYLSDCELLVEFHLARARYEYDLNQANFNVRAWTVTSKEINKAEKYAVGLKKVEKTWKEIRRKILLTRSRALLKLLIDDSKYVEECGDVIEESLTELEKELLNDMPMITKVEYFILKCDCAQATEKLTLAMFYASQALEISKRYQFPAEEKHAEQRLTKIQNILSLSEEQPADSSGLVAKVLDMRSTDTGNLESNAAEATDHGTFSTDDFSDLEPFVFRNQDKNMLAVTIENEETVFDQKSEFEEEDATAQMLSSSDSCDEFEETTWFEDHLMDEVNMDVNETTRNIMDTLRWVSTYGLAWPNNEIDYFHLVVYVKKEENRSNRELVQELTKTLAQKIVMHGTESEIENWVEFRRQTRDVKVKFLADVEPNLDISHDPSNEVKAVAKPGVNVLVNDLDDANPMTTPETRRVVVGNAPTKRGTLTAMCHLWEQNQNFALTCFHVGYRGLLNSSFTAPEIDLFRRHFEHFRSAARNPDKKQKETEYHYVSGNGVVDRNKNGYINPSQLGGYHVGLFDENQDILLIAIPPHVEFNCAIDGYSGHWGITRNDFKRKFQRNKQSSWRHLKNEVVRISAKGLRRGKIDHSGRSKNMPFTGMRYMVLSIDSSGPFLENGDSGSIVCMVTSENKYRPFAYGVCETDVGTDGSLSLCLDLKTALVNLQKALGSPLEPCFVDCSHGAVAED